MKGYTRKAFHCSRDGLRIAGTQYLPEGQGLPILIISHGFLSNQKSVRQYAEAFVKAGYACFIFDFNGGGPINKSQGKTEDMTVFTEAEDLLAVIDYAVSLPCTDPERLCLMGCSQGGFVSAITAARLGSRVEKLVLYFPALCIPDDARRGQMMFSKFDPDNIPKTFRCGPMKLGACYPESVLQADALELIAPYTGPVLLVHGTKDRIVDHRYSVQANERYVNSRLVSIPNADHGFKPSENRQAIRATLEFLK